jgi:hypothetical protein
MGGSEEIMWLALGSIVLALSIGFNVLALWLTDWFEKNRTTDLVSTNENEVSPPRPTGGHGFLPRGAKLLSYS